MCTSDFLCTLTTGQDGYLGWVEKAPPPQPLLLSPASPSSEPHNASCPPPLALHWHTTNKNANQLKLLH